ncbi:hypothetical protein GOV07_00230, partial [Candidatus Woesearchaeota archaeon]|nr:hypothetical protein [Candidatus Woesearchaeota archaeon]
MKTRLIILILLGILMLLGMSSLASAYYYGANTRYYGPVVYPASTHDNTYAYGRHGWNNYGINNYGGYLYPYATPYGGFGYGRGLSYGGGWGPGGFGYGTWRGGYGGYGG